MPSNHDLTDMDGDTVRFTHTRDGHAFVTVQSASGTFCAGPFTRAQLVEALDAVAPAGRSTGPHVHHDAQSGYKRTTPDPDETTGGALARLQAEMTRLLDEADAELRDEADGGVAAALIEKEAENADPAVDDRAMWWKAEREREKAERERDEARESLRESNEVVKSLRSLTAREHLNAAWDAAHTPEDGMIPAETEYLVRFSPGIYAVRKNGPEPISAESAFTRRLLDPPAPGPADRLRVLLDAYEDQDPDADDYEGRLSVYLARHGARVEEDR